jgi:hypothetical protein
MTKGYFPPDFLRMLRNQIPIDTVIASFLNMETRTLTIYSDFDAHCVETSIPPLIPKQTSQDVSTAIRTSIPLIWSWSLQNLPLSRPWNSSKIRSTRKYNSAGRIIASGRFARNHIIREFQVQIMWDVAVFLFQEDRKHN